jgi:hypothetical protein
MTHPTDESAQQQGSSDEQQGGGGRRRASAAAEGVGAVPEVLTVGHFTHRDRIFGTERERVGVVVKVGEKLLVAPLDHYRLEVAPADFIPITPDDLTA